MNLHSMYPIRDFCKRSIKYESDQASILFREAEFLVSLRAD